MQGIEFASHKDLDCEARIRGFGLESAKQGVRVLYGDDVLTEFASQLPPEFAKYINKRCSKIRWTPAWLMYDLFLYVVSEHDENMEMAAAIAYEGTRHDVGGMLAHVLRFMKTASALKRCASLWRGYFDCGELALDEYDPDIGFTVTLSDFPLATSVTALAVRGGIDSILETLKDSGRYRFIAQELVGQDAIRLRYGIIGDQVAC